MRKYKICYDITNEIHNKLIIYCFNNVLTYIKFLFHYIKINSDIEYNMKIY